MCWPHFRTFCRLIDRSHDAVCTSLTPCDTSVPRNCAQTQEQILDRLPLRGRRGDHVGSPLPSSTSTHSICRLRPGRCISFFSLTTGQLECLNTVTALICSTGACAQPWTYDERWHSLWSMYLFCSYAQTLNIHVPHCATTHHPLRMLALQILSMLRIEFKFETPWK
ncbi:hypothetical protein BDW68DRAFT_151207 [Aspergillus falconensis]